MQADRCESPAPPPRVASPTGGVALRNRRAFISSLMPSQLEWVDRICGVEPADDVDSKVVAQLSLMRVTRRRRLLGG